MTGGNDRAADYLRRAAEAEAQAAKIFDHDIREGFLKIAAEYRRMAGHASGTDGTTPPNR